MNYTDYEFLSPAIVGLLLVSPDGAITHPEIGAALWPIVAHDRGIKPDSSEWVDGGDKFIDPVSDALDTMIARGLLESVDDNDELWRYSLSPHALTGLRRALCLDPEPQPAHVTHIKPDDDAPGQRGA